MARRGFSKGSYRERIRALFRIKEKPHIMAASVAAAVLCGTSPYFVGIPLLPFLVRKFRLNKLVSVGTTVILLANPFMLLLMVFQLWLGIQMLGDTVPPTNLYSAAKVIGSIGLKILGDLFLHFKFCWPDILNMINDSKRLLLAYAVGGYSFALLTSGATLGVLWVWLNRRGGSASRNAGPPRPFRAGETSPRQARNHAGGLSSGRSLPQAFAILGRSAPSPLRGGHNKPKRGKPR